MPRAMQDGLNKYGFAGVIFAAFITFVTYQANAATERDKQCALERSAYLSTLEKITADNATALKEISDNDANTDKELAEQIKMLSIQIANMK